MNIEDCEVCFNPLKRVFAIFTAIESRRCWAASPLFQSPKTGLSYFHSYVYITIGNGKEGFNPLKRVFAIFTITKKTGQSWQHTILEFQSPKTGLCYFYGDGDMHDGEGGDGMFQSPKTGLCYFHGKVTYQAASLSGFQSPKTGLCYFHG